jgi:hypothetical protein
MIERTDDSAGLGDRMHRACSRAARILMIAASAVSGAYALEVRDTCAHCHPPLALPEAHPPRDGHDLSDCRACHVPGTGAGETLLRAMHAGHVEDMGFDCTICHVDAEDDLPILREELRGLLRPTGNGAGSHE